MANIYWWRRAHKINIYKLLCSRVCALCVVAIVRAKRSRHRTKTMSRRFVHSLFRNSLPLYAFSMRTQPKQKKTQINICISECSRCLWSPSSSWLLERGVLKSTYESLRICTLRPKCLSTAIRSCCLLHFPRFHQTIEVKIFIWIN